MSFEKILTIIVSEVVEAILFVILIIAIASIGSLSPLTEQLSGSIISGLVAGWVLLGIATPFAIWFEIWDAFGGRRRR